MTGSASGEILAGHFQSTRDRLATTDALVLVLHDTTEFTFHRSEVGAVGMVEQVLYAQEQARTPATLHRLRHSDALQPGGNHGRAPFGADRGQVLDAR